MANTKEKVAILKNLHTQQQALYAEKNEKYDDAFAKTYQEYGPTVAIIRLEDNLNRAKALVNAGLNESNGESLANTLIDMANYANMFLIELGATIPTKEAPQVTKKNKKKSKKSKDTESQREEDPTPEKGPLDALTKKELSSVVIKLGGAVPKKANRETLMDLINGYPKARVAVAITSLKSEVTESPKEEENEEEE